MRVVRLKPIDYPATLQQELEREIQRVLTKDVYVPLLKLLNLKQKTLKNSRVKNDLTQEQYSILGEALRFGNLTYKNGMFSGPLDASLTRALRDAGAKWDRRLSVFRLSKDELTPELSHMISAAQDGYRNSMKTVTKYLDKINPEEVSGKVAVNRIFENAIKRTEKSFEKNVAAITLSPSLTEQQRTDVINRWKEQAHHSITGLVQDQVSQLKSVIAQSVEVGTRYSNLTKGITHYHDVSKGRVKLIARQETKTLTNTYAQERYADAGVKEYYWHSVHGTAAHPVRPRHQALADASKNGTTYRFDDPPEVTEPGESPKRYENPGFDFNCVTGDSKINFLGSANKLFRRFYTGKLCKLVTASGVLNVTPNHPVLTSRGWLAAKDVQLGDDLVKIVFNNTFAKAKYTDDCILSFEKLFEFFNMKSVQMRHLGHGEQFHGDGLINQDIDVVSLEQSLMSNICFKVLQFFDKFKLSSTDVVTMKSSSSPLSYFYRLVFRLSIFSNSFMSSISQDLATFWSSVGHSGKHSLRTISQLCYPKMLQVDVDLVPTDFISFGQSQSANSTQVEIFDFFRKFWDKLIPRSLVSSTSRGINSSESKFFNESDSIDIETLHDVAHQHPTVVQFDRVIDHSVINFSGHVYNLENKVNWYACNGLIIHNCRCRAVPIVKFGGK